MGLLGSIKKAVTSSASADEIRADLSRAEHTHSVALAAFAEDETAANWELVEAAERQKKQHAARLARAEKMDRDAADARASADREREIIALGDLAKQINESEAILEAKKETAIRLATEVFREYTELLAASDRLNADMRALQERAARLGIPAPATNGSALTSVPMALRYITREVQKEHARNGVDFQEARRSVSLIEGSWQ